MITGIGHVAFRVRDIDRAKAFYCDGLGLRHAFDLDRDGNRIELMQMMPGCLHEQAEARLAAAPAAGRAK